MNSQTFSLRLHTTATEFEVTDIKDLPRVDIACCYAGADAYLVHAAQAAGACGLVVVGYGFGTLSDAVTQAMAEVAARGTIAVRASRAHAGRVLATPKNERLGLLASDDLSAQKARILLMLALTRTSERNEIQAMFHRY